MKQKLQKYIITGIMSIIPMALTYWIIKNLFLLPIILFFCQKMNKIITKIIMTIKSLTIKSQHYTTIPSNFKRVIFRLTHVMVSYISKYEKFVYFSLKSQSLFWVSWLYVCPELVNVSCL